MPRQNIKYELAADDEDTNNHYSPHSEDFQAFTRNNFIWHKMITNFLIIATYFVLSISLTFYQKWLFNDYRLHYPLSVVSCHLIFKFFLSAIIRYIRKCFKTQQTTRLSWKTVILTLGPPGVASGLDIGLSNWAISLITISLYTMTKSTTVIFILGFSLLFNLEKKSWSLVGIVIMISSGLFMFTYKSTQFQLVGFLLCLLASFSSGIRWTLAQIVMQKSKLGLRNPVDMMYYMQPWIILSLLPLSIYFEARKIHDNLLMYDWSDMSSAIKTFYVIIGGAGLAFSMEIMEYLVVTHGSSLTLSITGIVKDIWILVLAYEWNGDKVSGLNFVGLLMCLGGIIVHVINKVILSKTITPNDLDLDSGTLSNYAKLKDISEISVPMMMKNKSNSLTNLLNSEYPSSDEEEIFKNDNSRQILHNITQRREQ